MSHAVPAGDATGVLVVGIVFGAIFLCVVTVFVYLFESRKRQMKHLETMKALEVGLPPPDGEAARAAAAGLVATLGPALSTLGAVLATAVVLQNGRTPEQGPLLGTIWLCSAGVGITAVVLGVRSLRRTAEERPAKYIRGRGAVEVVSAENRHRLSP